MKYKWVSIKNRTQEHAVIAGSDQKAGSQIDWYCDKWADSRNSDKTVYISVNSVHTSVEDSSKYTIQELW